MALAFPCSPDDHAKTSARPAAPFPGPVVSGVSAGILLVASAALADVLAASPAPYKTLVDGPLLAMYRRHCSLVLACEAADVNCGIRDRLVARYGEPAPGVTTAAALWGHDREYPALLRGIRTSDRLNEERFDLQEEIEETEAHTLDGMLAKVRVALYVTCPGETEEMAYDLAAARETLIQTEQLLSVLTGDRPRAGE